MMTEVREAIAVVVSAIAVAAEMRDACAVPSAAAMPAATAHVSATKMAAADMAATANDRRRRHRDRRGPESSGHPQLMSPATQLRG